MHRDNEHIIPMTNKIQLILDRIKKAAKETGRSLDDITLVAVTKNVNISKIQEAIDSGIKIIGENKVQEAKEKYPLLNRNVEWHFIGHLQTNKVKDAVKIFELIHSIDRLELAAKLNEEAKKQNKIVKGLIQVNTAGEETKFGINKIKLFEFAKSITKFESLSIEGLMMMAPFDKDPNEVRQYFAETKLLFEKLKQERYSNVQMKWLSMGMSNDFEVAIEEGANMLRIGTALFAE